MGLLDALKRKDINEGIERFRKTEGAVLLDVREKDEYVQGHESGLHSIFDPSAARDFHPHNGYAFDVVVFYDLCQLFRVIDII